MGSTTCPQCTRDCERCDQGQIPCPRCEGAGYSVLPKDPSAAIIDCPACRGTGKRLAGAVTVDCGKCNSGKVVDGRAVRGVECSRCHAKKTIDCSDCEDGNLYCGRCKGKGERWEPCAACAGQGKANCPACGGLGFSLGGWEALEMATALLAAGDPEGAGEYLALVRSRPDRDAALDVAAARLAMAHGLRDVALVHLERALEGVDETARGELEALLAEVREGGR